MLDTHPVFRPVGMESLIVVGHTSARTDETPPKGEGRVPLEMKLLQSVSTESPLGIGGIGVVGTSCIEAEHEKDGTRARWIVRGFTDETSKTDIVYCIALRERLQKAALQSN